MKRNERIILIHFNSTDPNFFFKYEKLFHQLQPAISARDFFPPRLLLSFHNVIV